LTLLGDRYLCVGGKLLFDGSKRNWKEFRVNATRHLLGLGRPAFGIQPSKPLKILTSQAENDEADLAEMARGVAESLGLSACEMDQLRNRVQYVTVLGCTGLEFLSVVDRLLDAHRPDILRIDPLLAYIGADINKADETARFILRVGLDRLLSGTDVRQ
jgi:RecA-family ATPase